MLLLDDTRNLGLIEERLVRLWSLSAQKASALYAAMRTISTSFQLFAALSMQLLVSSSP